MASGKDSASATFKGTAPVASTYYAVYPYNTPGSSSTFATMATEGTFTTTFCSWYGALTAGALSNNLACAVSTDGSTFNFKSVGAVLKFTVPASLAGKLKQLTIAPCNGEKWVGATTVNLTGSTPVVTCTGSTKLTFKASLAEGTYYAAVAPATLAKGIYTVAEFSDGSASYYAYPANGAATTLSQNQIYNLGTLSDSDEIFLTSFNNGKPACQTTCYMNIESANNSDVMEGEAGKCLKISCKGSGSSSGQFSFDLSASKTDAVTAFPVKARPAYNSTRIRVYLGELQWYPTIKYSGSTYWRLPSKVNGVSFSKFASKNCTTLTDAEVSEFTALWQSAILTDNWNELEWNMDDWSSTISWNTNAFLNFYMCTSPKGANQSVKAGDTFYIDNIRFGVSAAARATVPNQYI